MILYVLAKSVIFDEIDVEETFSLLLSTYIRIPMLVGFIVFRYSGIERAFASWNTFRRPAE